MWGHIRNWWIKPPTLFPWAALFHVGITAHAIWVFRAEPALAWFYPVSLIIYTVFWFFVCSMHRWAAIGYVLFTSVNLLLQNLFQEGVWHSFGGALFPLDILFSFFVLFYYKRFS